MTASVALVSNPFYYVTGYYTDLRVKSCKLITE